MRIKKTVVRLTFTKDSYFSIIYNVKSESEIEAFTNAIMDVEDLQ